MSTKQTTLEEEVKELQLNALEHSYVGHKVGSENQEFTCAYIESKHKKKCNCGWSNYEKDLRKKVVALFTQRENALLERVIDMVEEKPGELGWSRSFNERLIKKLEAIKEENV